MEGAFHPRSIDLRFADGEYTFALPAVQLAELQKKRGWEVSWPDGSRGIRNKPFGLIWREHATGDYDPLDSREIVRLALIGGGKGRVDKKPKDVDSIEALDLVEVYFDPWPTEKQWQFATAIISAVCQGFEVPKGEGSPPADEEDGDSGNAERATTAISPSTSPESSATAPSAV